MNENLKYVLSRITRKTAEERGTKVLLLDDYDSNVIRILEKYLNKVYPRWFIKTSGTNQAYIDVLTQSEIDWADCIFVMNARQEMDLKRRFKISKPIKILGISKEYEIYNEDLKSLLEWMHSEKKFDLGRIVKPRILIGVPINDIKLYCWEEFSEHTKKLGYPVLIVDTSKNNEMKPYIKREKFMYAYYWAEKAMDRVVGARNMIAEYAIENDYDYVMWVDSDVMVKPGIIEKLLSHDKELVSAVYNTIGKNEFPRIVHNIETEKSYEPMPVDYIDTGLRQASQIGFGCVLTKIDVLEKVKFRCERYQDTGYIRYGEDYCFSNDIWLKHDIPIWVDTDIQVPHKVNEPWDLDNT